MRPLPDLFMAIGPLSYSGVLTAKGKSVEFKEYQREARKTKEYPALMGLVYTSLGLAGEAGEYANKVKKTIRDGQMGPKSHELAAELGDVLWYVSAAADELGYTLDEIAGANLRKLQDRAATGNIRGSGDDR